MNQARRASASEIKELLAKRIDQRRQNVGMVVGVTNSGVQEVVAHGTTSLESRDLVNCSSVFEIGCLTKVFTGLLLSQMISTGEVSLFDPISKYFASNVQILDSEKSPIRLIDLATHTAGLGRWARKSCGHKELFKNEVEEVSEFLRTCTVGEVGRYRYSHSGFWVLAHALSQRASQPFEVLLSERILEPLAMFDTQTSTRAQQIQNRPKGHDGDLKPLSPTSAKSLTGASGWSSTAVDLLKFLNAHIEPEVSILGDAVQIAMKSAQRSSFFAGVTAGLGWHMRENSGKTTVFHYAVTNGYSCGLGFDPKEKFGVVVLSNADTKSGVADIIEHLLAPANAQLIPIESSRLNEVRSENEIRDPMDHAHVVGEYKLTPRVFFSVFFEEKKLYGCWSTEGKRHQLFPQKEGSYLYWPDEKEPVPPTLLIFDSNPNGTVTELRVKHLGWNPRLVRISGGVEST